MSDIENSSQPVKRGRWRFTLRELLLAIVALSAIFALIAQSRRFSQTPFFDSFDGNQALTDACRKLSLAYDPGAQGRSTSLHTRAAVRSLDIEIRSPPPSKSGQVITGLRREIESALTKHDCHIYGRGWSGDLDLSDIDDFHFDYTRGSTHGDIYVSSFAGSGKSWKITILIHEL